MHFLLGSPSRWDSWVTLGLSPSSPSRDPWGLPVFLHLRCWLYLQGKYQILEALMVAQWLRICLQGRRCKRCSFSPWVGKIPWRRKWHPTPVLLPGESHGQRSLAGYSPWGRKELDMTEHEREALTPAFSLGSNPKERHHHALIKHFSLFNKLSILLFFFFNR